MRRRQAERDAVTWALDEAEAQLRQEPAHRLTDDQREYAWGLTAPNGIGVYVEADIRTSTAGSPSVEAELLANSSGLLRASRGERSLVLSLTGQADRVPALLYLVFENGGDVHASETLAEAEDSLEAAALSGGQYAAAFSDQGEVINMKRGATSIDLEASWIIDEQRWGN